MTDEMQDKFDQMRATFQARDNELADLVSKAERDVKVDPWPLLKLWREARQNIYEFLVAVGAEIPVVD